MFRDCRCGRIPVAVGLGAVVLVLPEHVDALPAPVNVMGPDESVLDFHHFDKVHLFALGALARVLPGRSVPVGEEAGSVVLADLGRAREYLGQEGPKLVVAAADARRALDVRHYRAPPGSQTQPARPCRFRRIARCR